MVDADFAVLDHLDSVAGVVRLDDKTTQNNGNTEGKVVRAADLDGLIKKFLEETAAAAAPPAGTGPAPGTGPDDGRSPDGDGQTPHFTETITVTATPDPDEECVLVDATMTRGNRSAQYEHTMVITRDEPIVLTVH